MIMMYLALIINTAIIVFTNNAPEGQNDALDDYLIGHKYENPLFIKFLFVVVFEHVLLLIVSLLVFMSEKMPGWLKIIYKMREYKKSLVIKL